MALKKVIFLFLSLLMTLIPTLGATSASNRTDCENAVLNGTDVISDSVVNEMAELYLSLFHSERTRTKSDLKSEEIIWQEKLEGISKQIPDAEARIRAAVNEQVTDYQKVTDSKIEIVTKTLDEQQGQVRDLLEKHSVCNRNIRIKDELQRQLRKDCSQITFQDLQSIDTLDFMFKYLGELTSNDFWGLGGLKSLSIENSSLKSLPEDVFDTLVSLRNLDISTNEFEVLPPNIFRNLVNLETLRIDHTRLKSIDEKQFVGLDALRDLSISRSKIAHLPKKLLWPLINLTDFGFHESPITEIPEDLFIKNRRIKSISFAAMTMAHLPQYLFKGLSELKVLYLSNSKFTKLPKNLFVDLGELEDLYLHNNLFKSLPNDLLVNNLKIKNLTLQTNPIVTLPRGLFRAQSGQVNLEISKTPKMLALEELGFFDSFKVVWK